MYGKSKVNNALYEKHKEIERFPFECLKRVNYSCLSLHFSRRPTPNVLVACGCLLFVGKDSTVLYLALANK